MKKDHMNCDNPTFKARSQINQLIWSKIIKKNKFTSFCYLLLFVESRHFYVNGASRLLSQIAVILKFKSEEDIRKRAFIFQSQDPF